MIPIAKKVSGDKNVKFRAATTISPSTKTKGKLLLLPLRLALKDHIDPYQFVSKRSTLDAVIIVHYNIAFSLKKG